MSKKCILQCVKNSHTPIHLPHNKPIIIGRTKTTGIQNPSLSRNQLKVVADYDSSTVLLTPLGVNPCGVNGFSLIKHKEYTVKHEDRIELLLDQYVYEVRFEDTSKKRIYEDDDEVVDRSKKQKPNSTTVVGWEEIDNSKLLIYTDENVKPRAKIASFDMDGTLVCPKSGQKFPKDAEDWKFLYPEVPKKLQQLHADGYKLVIFTNQKGISLGKTKVAEFKKKIELVLGKIPAPVQVFVATGKGIYRKPSIGMWDSLNQKNNSIEIDLNESFYCGDAAGREKNWAPKMPKDHSIADRLFALNLDIPFKTPEEFFRGARSVPFKLPEFNPKAVLADNPSGLAQDTQELIVFVGGPASGKTSFCKQHLIPEGYVHVNRDQLGSWQKCVTQADNSLKMKQSVVIDNTNPDKESRKRFIDLAKKYGIGCRCFLMETTVGQARHNNLFREITDNKHQLVSDIIIYSYRKNFIEPTLDEGFSSIIKLNCVPKFSDEHLEKLYHMYLLEK